MPAASRLDQWRLRLFARSGQLIVMLLTLCLLTLVMMYLGYQVKVSCGGPPFHPDGRSVHFPVGVGTQIAPCYSDLMYLWTGRDINNHVFPYIHGWIDDAGVLHRGVVEYPVASGLLMYLGAIGAHNDTQFLLHSAILLAPFGLAITILLGLMVRWWALWWAATPPLLLYAFHNWELPVVFTSVLAIAVMAFGASRDPATGERHMSLRTSSVLASVVLGVGFTLKLYPGFFVAPLALFVLLYGRTLTDAGSGSWWARMRAAGLDWVGAVWVVVAAAVTVLAINLPFMLLGWRGWRASLSFQGKRKAVVDTNSIWYWGLRHFTGGTDNTYNSIVGVASPLLILATFVFALYLGYRVWLRDGIYPWVGVSASMLAGFMLFHKVHSPQYTLWILPFFVLLRVWWPVIVAYIAADTILDLTIFRLFGIYTSHSHMKWWVMTGVNVGVWVKSAILLVMIVMFIRVGLREPLASVGRMALPPKKFEKVPA